MTQASGSGKYEQLLERCRGLEPIPDRRGRVPLRGVGPGGCSRSRPSRLDPADPRGSGGPDPGDRAGVGDRPGGTCRSWDAHGQPCGGRAVGGAGARGQGRAARRRAACTGDEILGGGLGPRDPACGPGRRISHAFIMDVPTYHKVLIVTDGAIDVAPTLEDKVDICQNAIDLGPQASGSSGRRSRSSAAVETVNSRMTATPRRGGPLQDGGALSNIKGRRSSMDRSPSTTPSARTPRGPRASGPRWRAIPTSCWPRISRRATSWRSSSSSWRTPTAPGSSSAPACPSS